MPTFIFFCKKWLEINNDLVEVRFLRRSLIAVKTNFIRSNGYRDPIFSHTLHERILIDSLMLRGIAFVDIHFNAPKEQGVYDYHPISLYYINKKWNNTFKNIFLPSFLETRNAKETPLTAGTFNAKETQESLICIF